MKRIEIFHVLFLRLTNKYESLLSRNQFFSPSFSFLRHIRMATLLSFPYQSVQFSLLRNFSSQRSCKRDDDHKVSFYSHRIKKE